ncbi:MAG: SDR family NAD(P)-dependent oxidoreductase [Bacteroidetes bacterium]|nr:MAG: SDR family NAD(P)-dependent oxidoreductase [Bacteroidota bacterium]
MKFRDKVIIVTGATSGMGMAIAEHFAREGGSVIISGRNEQRGEELASHLKKINDQIIFIAGDIRTPQTNQLLVETALLNFGKIDILSANAGILGLGSVTQVSPDTWQSVFDTNLNAVFYLCKYAIPHLLENENGGNIIINASIAAFKSFPNHPAYCASKAAVVALMKQMAVEYAPKIRINAICPGPVDTPLLWDSAKAFEEPEKAVADAKEATLLKRLGTPEDIAKLVCFLASEDSSWITGTSITIDGGILNV